MFCWKSPSNPQCVFQNLHTDAIFLREVEEVGTEKRRKGREVVGGCDQGSPRPLKDGRRKRGLTGRAEIGNLEEKTRL